jgi:hypothetical protein
MSFISNPVIFNNYYFENVPGLTVLSTDPYKAPKRNLSVSSIARSHKNRHNSGFYKPRIINITVGISRPTRALLEASIDQLESMLDGINKVLEIPQSGVQRQYYCSYSDYQVQKDGGSYIELVLTFECTDSFGYSKTQDTLLAITSAYTSAFRSDRLTFGGSAPTQVPIIRITLSAVSGATAKTMSIGNGQTGQVVVITRTFIAGDFIEIDTQNDTVKVNNIEVAFTGAIPKWANSDLNPFGWWTYADTFDSRSFTGSILCNKRYK